MSEIEKDEEITEEKEVIKKTKKESKPVKEVDLFTEGELDHQK